MSVLAHVVLRSLPPEPAATQALGYICQEPEALSAFMVGLAFTGVSFEPSDVQTEAAFEGCRPDLAVYDGETPRLLVENKFWAGLTEAQPVAYLQELPQDRTDQSALVFIVPEARLWSVWRELIRRCQESELVIGEEFKRGEAVYTELPDNRVLAVTSWKSVLDKLQVVSSVRDDVEQLRALTELMDAEEFLPIGSDELTNAALARRLINYADLIEPIVEELKQRDIGDTTGLRVSHSYHTTGRYLYMHGRLGVWLGVHLHHWRDAGTTPLWWVSGKWEWGGVREVWEKLDGMFDDIRGQGEWKSIPIQLKTGVERHEVVRHAADQIQEIADSIVAELAD